MPAGVVPHYKQCLLVWGLTIVLGVACWHGISHYRQCLLVRWHCNQHFTSQLKVEDGWLKSGATCTEVPLHQKFLLISCHSQICLLLQCNYIRHACLEIIQTSGKASGL